MPSTGAPAPAATRATGAPSGLRIERPATCATSAIASPARRGAARRAKRRLRCECDQRSSARSEIVLYPTNSLYKFAPGAELRRRHANKATKTANCLARRNTRRRNMRTRALAALFACWRSPLAALDIGACGRPGQDFELKLSHWVPPSHPLQKALEDWGGSDREGLERHHQVQGLSLAAARQGLRPLRHGARRHRRPHLCQSRLSARPLPDHRRRRICRSWSSNAKGGSQALDAWYRKYAEQRDEGREVLPRLRARSGLVPLQDQEDRGARRHQGHEDPAGARHHGDARHAARRHQRAVVARRKCATSSRRAWPTP